MNKEDIYSDFNIIKSMKSPEPIKVRMITQLMISYEDVWRVVGITKEALQIFKSHDFKKVSKMGINRSHIKQDRHKTYKILLEANFSFNDWWDYFIENDETILSTSSENMGKKDLEIFCKIDSSLGLFKAKGFSWRHSADEINFLKGLYDTMILKESCL